MLFLEAIEQILPGDMKENTAGLRENVAHLMIDLSSFLGRYEQCIAITDYLIQRYPNNAQYYWKKALYLHTLGRLEDAIPVLDEAIARDPNNIEYLLKKARISQAIYRFDESNQTYEKISQIAPRDALQYAYAGDAALDQGKYGEAFDRYTKSLELAPSDPLIWEKRGDVIFALLTIPTAGQRVNEQVRNMDLYSEGMKSYENAIRLRPEREREIEQKMSKRSDEYTPRTIKELESRYTQYRYLG